MSLSWFLIQPFSPIPRDALLPLLLPAQSLSRVLLFVVSWTVAHHAPLSMEFSRQEYWSELPFPPPGDLPDPRIEPASPA